MPVNAQHCPAASCLGRDQLRYSVCGSALNRKRIYLQYHMAEEDAEPTQPSSTTSSSELVAEPVTCARPGLVCCASE